MSTCGVVMYGVNNSRINYVQIANANAKLVKHFMQVPITLITDDASKKDVEPGVFDQIIIDPTTGPQNDRTYRDTIYHEFTADFKNYNRPSIYHLSPYDETLLIDVDYLIQSDILNNCWGSVEDVLINNDAISLMNEPLTGNEYRLSPQGIRMFWATVVYFKKSDIAETLFDMVCHVRDYWEFYQVIYGFPNVMYRNDYAFSIAIHTMNGFLENAAFKPLPVPYILTATDCDQIYSIDEKGILMFANDTKERHIFRMTRIKGLNVHCMNKVSILRNLQDLELLK